MKKFLRKPVLFVLGFLILTGLIPTIFYTSHSVKVHASGSTSITLSASSAQPGTILQASGQGFVPSDSVSINLNSSTGPLLASAVADSSGKLPATNIIVPDLPAGNYTLVATDGSLLANGPLTIIPVLTLSQSTFHAGQGVTLVGKGFLANNSLDVYYTTGGYPLLSVKTDANGGFSYKGFTTSGATQGQHNLIASTGSVSAQATITLLPGLFTVSVKPGMSVYLQGGAFLANEKVSIYWGTANGLSEGTATTDTWGGFSYSFTAPTNIATGSYQITAVRTNQKPAIVGTLAKVIALSITTPGGVHSEQPFPIQLTGFLPYDMVSISWNANGGQSITTVSADQLGAAKTSIVVPSAVPGTYTLTAQGRQDGLSVSTSVNVGPGVSAPSSFPGDTITVSGGGFSPNETVQVYFQLKSNGIVSTTTDATGAFTVPLTLPNKYVPGKTYYIYATNTTGTEHSYVAYTFWKPLLTVCDASNYYNCGGDFTYGQPAMLFLYEFALNETVHIIWNYQHAGQYTITSVPFVTNSGTVVAQVTIPSTPNQSSVTVAAVGSVSGLIATSTITNDIMLKSTPNTGTVGTKVSVTGGSFGASDTITLSLQGKVVATTTSKADGSFSTTFKVPAITSAGNLTLIVSDATATITGTIPFQYSPVIAVNPTTVHNGDIIQVKGRHFTANANVNIQWYDSGPYQPTTVKTDANGTFTTTMLVIAPAGSGATTLTAYDISGVWATQTVYVQ